MNFDEYNNQGIRNYPRMTTDQNDRYVDKIHSNQIYQATNVDSSVKINESLKKENEDLKELCVYLDDERARLDNLLQEHQKFGKLFFSNLQVGKMFPIL